MCRAHHQQLRHQTASHLIPCRTGHLLAGALAMVLLHLCLAGVGLVGPTHRAWSQDVGPVQLQDIPQIQLRLIQEQQRSIPAAEPAVAGAEAANNGPPPGRVVIDFGSDGWQYLDTGKEPEDGWLHPDFEAEGWKKGKAILGYGDDDVATVVSYGKNAAAKHRVTYVRRTFELENTDGIESCGLRLIVDDGAVVYLNGKEIVRQNVDLGAVDSSTLSQPPSGVERKKWCHLVDAKDLIQGKNVLAASVHQCDDASSDLAIDAELRVLDTEQAAQFSAMIAADKAREEAERRAAQEEQIVELEQVVQQQLNAAGGVIHINRVVRINRHHGVAQPVVPQYFADGAVTYRLATGRESVQYSDAAQQVNQSYPYIRFARARAGDTIEKLAVQQGLDAELLRKMNRVATGHVYREDELVCVRWWHRVLKAETLESIAKLYSMDMAVLALINDLSTETSLEEGQVLSVAGRYEHQLPERGARRQGQLMLMTVVAQSNFRSQLHVPQVPPGLSQHTVGEGATLASIAQNYGVTPEFLRQLNRMEPDEELGIGDVVTTSHRVRVNDAKALSDVLFAYGVELSDILQLNGAESADTLIGNDGFHLPHWLVRAAPQSAGDAVQTEIWLH